MCREDNCGKNHITYFKDRKGTHAELVLWHFKNDAIKGVQHVPLAPKLLEKILFLEQARAAIYPTCPTLFCDTQGLVYKSAYFSTVVSKACILGDERLTANDYRHLFATAWRDFINCPTTKLLDLTVHQLNAAAADMMLNSTEAWSAAYDDTNRNRGIFTVLAKWPKFVEFVKEAHLDLMSKDPIDPLTVDLASLSLA